MILDENKIVVTTIYIGQNTNMGLVVHSALSRCYDNKASIITCEYTNEYYVYENGSIVSPDRQNPQINVDMLVSFDNPFDAYNYFQEVLDNQNDQQQQEQQKKDARIPFIRTNANGDGKVYTCDGNFENIQDENQDITLGTFDINAPAQKDISVTIGNETKEGILIKYPPLDDSNDRQAFFFMIGDPSPNDPQPPQAPPKQMLFLTDNEITSLDAYQGQFYELVDGQLQNTNQDSFVFVTELDPEIKGAIENQEAILLRMPNFDQNGKFAYALSSNNPDPKKVVFLTINEMLALEPYMGTFYEVDNDGNLTNTNQTDIANITELNPLKGNMMNKDYIFVRKPNYDTDAMFAYEIAEDKEPEEIVFLSDLEITSVTNYNGQVYKVENDVVTELKGNLIVNVIDVSNGIKINMNGQDVFLIRTPNLDANGKIAYKFASQDDEDKKETFLGSAMEISSNGTFLLNLFQLDDNKIMESLNKSINIEITDFSQSPMLGLLEGEDVTISLNYDMTDNATKNPNHYFIYNIFKEGNGNPKGKGSGNKGDFEIKTDSDILNKISDVTGISVNKLFSYLGRDIEMGQLFLESTNFADIQQVLNTTESQLQLSTRINQAIKDNTITID